MSAKAWLVPVGLLLLAGCTFPVRDKVDDIICRRSHTEIDVLATPEAPQVKFGKMDGLRGEEESENANGLFLTTAQADKLPSDLFLQRLEVPSDLPGAETPSIFLPQGARYKEAVEKFFPPVPRVQRDPDFPPGPDGVPLSLAELQKIASANSPLLRQAAANVEAARGAAIQAGLYPNPILGYTASSAGPSGGPTFGLMFGQTVVLMGKLKLAQAAALMDLKSAELALRRAETDLTSAVRTNYYAVLVAQESIRANRGLVELTDEMYRVLVDQLKGGSLAVYEPLQMRVFAEQARTALVQARNGRLLAWKQLAASMGVPTMPATALAGTVRCAVPRLNFEKALALVLTNHTDVLSTMATIQKARHSLRLAEVNAYPDVAFQGSLQDDVTPPGPSRVITTLQATVPVPVWNRNQGNIRQAQATLMRANEEPHRVQADLTARFSEAYRRYEEGRQLLEMYHKNILPKQVQAFRAAVKRHYGGEAGGVAYNDLISSEQNLVTVIGAYIVVLQAQWLAVVDVANFLQTDQLYQAVDALNAAPEVDFEQLLKMPCHHPCAPGWLAPSAEGFRMAPATLEAPQPSQTSLNAAPPARP